MELAGLEPAPSWVRFLRLHGLTLAWLSASRTSGAPPPTPSQQSAGRSPLRQRCRAPVPPPGASCESIMSAVTALGDAGFTIMAIAALLATASSINSNIFAAGGL